MNHSVLTRLYERGIQGLPLLGQPSALAERMNRESRDDTVESTVGLYTLLCGSTGFLCGLPGYASMPLTVPANVGGVLLLQLHMTATLAEIYDHDVTEETTRDTCIRCVLEHRDVSTIPEGLEAFSRRLGVKMVERGVRFVSEQATWILGNQRRARSLPLVGGVAGGVSDGYATRQIANAAQRAFNLPVNF